MLAYQAPVSELLESYESYLPGGLQVLEPSNAHLVTEDTIKRFGGSTAPTAPWPKEASDDVEEDKLPLGRESSLHLGMPRP